MKSFAYLENLIEMWGRDLQIIQNGKPMGQAIKTAEEVVELLAAINAQNHEETMDAIGDIIVTLVMICAQIGVTIPQCMEMAYESIKDRKGYLLPTGVFVKVE